jgi:hypothetical protein
MNLVDGEVLHVLNPLDGKMLLTALRCIQVWCKQNRVDTNEPHIHLAAFLILIGACILLRKHQQKCLSFGNPKPLQSISNVVISCVN